jgi:hypothetical protein
VPRAQLLKEHLRVEVLNARHLKPPEIHRGEATPPPRTDAEGYLAVNDTFASISTAFCSAMAEGRHSS